MGIRDALPGRDEWDHGPVMGTINAAGAALTAAALGHAADLDPHWGAIGGAAGAAGAVISGRRADLSAGSIGYRAGCFACAGAWITRALATTPWDVTHLGMLTAGAVGAGVLAPALARHERTEQEKRHLRLAITARQARAGEWEERLTRVCAARGVRVLAVQTWPTALGPDGQEHETGYTVEVALPRGGMTWRDIASRAERLASDADLPEGCTVEVSAGARRSRVLLRVSTLNALATALPYPSEHPNSSATTDYAIGRLRDSAPALVHTRERTVLVVGQKGGGKTNLLHVFIARLSEMVDQLVWVIDLNGGGLAQAWLRPWLHRQAPRPAVDWAAATVEEALLMTRAAIAIGRGRKTAYRDLRHAHNTDLLPVSATLPQITIIVDESKSITGDGVRERARVTLGEDLLTIQEELRAEGVNLIRCSLRPTGSALGGIDARVQSAIQIMMKPGEPEELHKLFANSAGLSAEDAPYPGNGWLAVDGGRPSPMQVYRLKPQDIERIALAVSDRRPALDTPSAGLAGPTYATRWAPNRLAWLTTDTPAEMTAASTTGRETRRPAPPGVDPDTTSGIDTGAMDGLAAQLRAERLAADADRATFDAIVSGWDQTTPDPEDAGSTPTGPAATELTSAEIRGRMLEFLYTAGPAGKTATEIWEAIVKDGHDRSRQAVSEWLRSAVATGQVVQPVPRGPYIHADHAPRTDDGQ
ncbi:hypothetical protein [Frankia sp. CiP3]|uniref:hypothetical protein n=1 Tax=Frankia sp. CiP3 TaxID=2880971 RepID=UPI001EF5EAA9|nr:hypothetical protein [Frankia sp. CiP3]